MRANLTPRNIFLIVALVVTAIIGFFSYHIAENKFQLYVSEAFKKNSQEYINNIAAEYFDLNSSISLRNSGNQVKFINGLKNNSSIKAAKISDANGTIIASSNTSEVNIGLLDDQVWQRAIGGQNQLTNISTAEKKGTLYLPLISTTGVVKGVVIVDSTLPESYLATADYAKSVITIIIGSSLAFILIAYIIMFELEDRMAEKERSIFDRSRAQTEEKQLYEAITSSIAESLIVINKNNQIMMLNPEAEKMIGHKGSAVEYRSYQKIINFYDEKGKRLQKDPIASAIKKGETIHISSKDNFYIKNQANNLVPVAINIAPVVGNKSFIKGVALTIIDISTEKELQAVKDEFVYVVAHELGNPIFALDGYLSLLQDKNKRVDKQTKEILNGAHSINQQLSSLVNDLLEVSRNETGRLTFDFEKINLSKIAEEVVKSNSFKAREKSITLTYKNAKTPDVVGNEHKIKEVFTNLVDNAIKYTPKGGAVNIALFQHDNKVIVSVKDSGIGITEDNQKNLFQKFFRVKNKATEGISGTGLGLFIAKQIVEKCGGAIWATSEEGKGSTFSFSLKLAKAKK